jgi:hypothetical protein
MSAARQKDQKDDFSIELLSNFIKEKVEKYSLEEKKSLLSDIELKQKVTDKDSDRKVAISDQKQIRNISSSKRSSSAISIQRFWRLHRFKKNFFTPRNSEIFNGILQQAECKPLSEFNYGRIVAGVRLGVLTPDNDTKPAQSSYFPAYQNPKWYGYSYHRDDFSDIINITRSDFAQNVINHFVKEDKSPKHPEEKISNEYIVNIPITIANNFSIDDFKEQFLTDNESKLLTIYREENMPIGIVSIKIAHLEKKEAIKAANNICTKINAVGLIASPWEIAKLNAKLLKKTDKKESQDQKAKSYHYQPNQFRHLPDNIADLKKSKMLKELDKIAKNPKNPNRYLATLILDMISGLPDEQYSLEQISRLALILNMAVLFYKHNYERFAFLLYGITHEISLLLNGLFERGKTPLDYNQFKEMIDKNDNSYFGLDLSTLENSTSIAAPAMSGTHAFSMAMSLAKKLSPNKSPKIGIIKPCYFEFEHLLKEEKQSEDKEQDHLKDIYLLSTGPIINNEGVAPGTDINKLVEKLLQGKDDFPKPIVFVMDTTSSLRQNLKLNAKTQELVNSGKISIIGFESYQKFGLAHTDQAQAGAVFGICNNQSNNKKTLHDFSKNAEKDLMTHIDMMIAAYMHQKGGKFLESIKKEHFNNGKLFRDFFIKSKQYNPDDSEVYYPEMLNNLNELYFMIITSKNINLSRAVNSIFPIRDSFGHFSTTLSVIDKRLRLSASASDEIDTLTQITSLYFASHLSNDQLCHFLCSHFLEKSDSVNELDAHQQILLAGLLHAITSRQRLSLSQELILSSGIALLNRTASKEMLGRAICQNLSYRFQNSEELSTTVIDKNTFHIFLTKPHTYKEIVSIQDDLIGLEKKGIAHHTIIIKNAMISLKLAHLWDQKIPTTNKKVHEFDFKGNIVTSSALYILAKEKLLNHELVFPLLKNDKYSKKLASCITELHNQKLLHEKDILLTFSKNDEIAHELIKHLYKKIDSNEPLTPEDLSLKDSNRSKCVIS